MPTARLPAFLATLLPFAAAATAQDLHLPLDRSDASWHGATAVADGVTGGAAHFDGKDARIDGGPCPIDGKAPFTLRLSLRTTRGDFCTPLMARAGEAVGISIVVGRQPGVVSFEAWSWGSVKLLSKGRIDDGRWHAIEVAYDPASTVALLFVDGALQGTAELASGGSPAAQLRLGDNIGAQQPFLGDLDEVHFERTLTHRERFAGMAAVLPLAEREAALRRWRESMLPRHTRSLEPTAQPDWPRRRLQVRAHVADSLGLSPEPARLPLDVQVHGELRGDGFVVQRMSWRSWVHRDYEYRATGWLWLPDPLTVAPHAAVLCPHGHWQDGALHPVVQARCMSFARLGWITLAVDSVHVEDVASGVSAIGAMTWNNLRGLELLQARTDVDRTRIAVTGASGGGQQTYYLMAIRDAFAAAAPICMTCYFAEILTDDGAHCGCNHPPRLAGGTDVLEMAAVMAPRPAFFGSVTGDWTAHFPQQGWPELQGLWQRLGAGKAIGARHADEGHNYDQPMREAVYAFLRPVLQPGTGSGPVAEPPVTPIAVRDLQALGGPAPRTPPDQQALAAEFLARRPPVTALRQLAPGLPWRVEPAPIAWRSAEGAVWRAATVPGPGGVPVPFLVSAVDDAKAPWIVVDAALGKAALLAAAPQWLGMPRVVLVDPRGRGEWQRFAPYWRRNGLILGCGEGYLAAHDLAQVCASLPGDAPVTVVGLGAAGVEALLAAALTARITHVVTDDFGRYYSEDGNRLPFCPELSRYGGILQLVRDVEDRCELRLGGTARGGSPHRVLCAPLDERELLQELSPRSR